MEHLKPIVYRDSIARNVLLPYGQEIPLFAFDIYDSRIDLQRAMPGVRPQDLVFENELFLNWINDHGVKEYPGLANFLQFYVLEKGCSVRSMQAEENHLVSIIVPTRNRPQMLEKFLRTIQLQSYKRWQLILIDGSDDTETELVTKKIIEPDKLLYIRSLPSKHKLLEQNVACARNIGTSHALGEFIAHADDDNIWHPYHLRKLVDPLAENPNIAMSIGLHRLIDNNTKKLSLEAARVGSSLPIYNSETLIRDNFIASDDVLIRRDIISSIKPIREDLPYFADWEYWARIAINFNVIQIYEMLTDYYIHPESITEKLKDTDEIYIFSQKARELIEDERRRKKELELAFPMENHI